MNIYKVLPDLNKKRQLGLWHKALRSQWSAEDMNWSAPQRMTNKRLKDGLARVLTPVLMGEQAALYSVSALIPILGHQSHVDAQFYLTTWAVDEARHTELFTRFYGRIDREPMSIRRFPAGYLFQSKISAKDPGEWLSGVLVSECAAKVMMQEFVRLDLDPVLSEISDGILVDEARHLAFNHVYMEDVFADLYRKGREEAETYGEELKQKLEDVLTFLPPMFEALASEMDEVGIERERVLEQLADEARERLESSIRRGARVAAREVDGASLVAAADTR